MVLRRAQDVARNTDLVYPWCHPVALIHRDLAGQKSNIPPG